MIDYPSEDAQKKYYNNSAHERHLNDRLMNIRKYLSTVFRSYIDIKTVLEVGCGVGVTSEFMLAMNKEVTGVDLSEKHIELSKVNAKGGKFVCSNFVSWTGPSVVTHYDLIALFDVLEHIPKHEHKQVFAQIKKYSHPYTKIAIIIPLPEYLDKVRETRPEILQPIDESIYPDHIDPLFKEFNLKVISMTDENEYRRYLLEYK